MYFYQIGYGTCEESMYFQLVHEKKFSKGELNALVRECMLEALVRKAKPKSKWHHQRSPSVQDVMEPGLQEEGKFLATLRKQGFKQITFEQQVGLFGWASAINPDDWRSHTSTEHRRFVRDLRRDFLRLRPNYLTDLAIGKEKERRTRERSSRRRSV